MLHPSYVDLIDVVNKDVPEGEEPVVTSRYSIILAAARRARQLVDGADPTIEDGIGKPLSTAVEELYRSTIHILPPEEDDLKDDTEKMFEMAAEYNHESFTAEGVDSEDDGEDEDAEDDEDDEDEDPSEDA